MRLLLGKDYSQSVRLQAGHQTIALRSGTAADRSCDQSGSIAMLVSHVGVYNGRAFQHQRRSSNDAAAGHERVHHTHSTASGSRKIGNHFLCNFNKACNALIILR